MSHPERRDATDPEVLVCTADGVAHDFRHHSWIDEHGKSCARLRCVWCHALACGDLNDPDPCIEPIRHQSRHRSVSGVSWATGSRRGSIA